ncbi:hypothetical protein BDW22DRAFT_1405021 [Trametopsis cervina]|nr:hypothetical protein BDW22DRAFT_1405021 [Trametopsis cervina]
MSVLRMCTALRRIRTGSDLTEVDQDGIPVRPTWSVNELLTSYPKPTIPPSTIKRMYQLSALVPPAENTSEHAQITAEMEDLVKLVEAVRLVQVDEHIADPEGHGVPDGRIWAEGMGISLKKEVRAEVAEDEGAHGRALLKHAQRTHNGFYVVDKSSRRE